MNRSFLHTILDQTNFKIDTLLPNYLIYNKLHPHDEGATLQFDKVMANMKSLFEKAIKFYISSIRRDSVPKKLQIIQQQIEDELAETNLPEKISKLLFEDLQVFLYGLTQLQDVYTEFLKLEFYNLLELKDVLDDRINMNWFNEEISELVVCYLSHLLGTAKGLVYHLILEQIDFTDLILYLNKIITQIFTGCAMSLKQITGDFIQTTNESALANKYLLMGLFQELSNRAYDLVNDYQEFTIFHYSNQDAKEDFARVVINHFDHLQLYVNRHDEEILTPFQQDILDSLANQQDELDVIENTLKTLVKSSNQIVTHKIVSKITLKPGLLIEISQEGIDKVKYILHKPKHRFVLTFARLVLNRWVYEEALQGLTPEQLLEKKEQSQVVYSSIEAAFNSLHFQGTVEQLEDGLMDDHIAFFSNTQQTAEFQNVINSNMPMPQTGTVNAFHAAAGDIGASLGNCLANINKYPSRKAFLKDFGQCAAVSGSITMLAQQMPIVGQLVALGGFGYFTMKIYSSETASELGKSNQMNKLVISTTANIGSGIGGAIIGQALIPIPLLGALIGGFLGGLVGGASSSVFLDYMSEKRFAKLFDDLISLQQKGHWQYTDDLLNSMGMSKQAFEQSMPANLLYDEYRQTKWLSMVFEHVNQIIYTFITVYQQQKDNLKMKESEEQDKADLEEFPDFIESSIKWIIREKCLLQLALENVTAAIKCIFQNL